MVIEESIKVSNYKCFGDDPQGFDRIMPINIIIGKNNSGKSSLIELLEGLINLYVTEHNHLPKNNYSRMSPAIHLTGRVTESTMKSTFNNNNVEVHLRNANNAGIFLNQSFEYIIENNRRIQMINWLDHEQIGLHNIKRYGEDIVKHYRPFVTGKNIRRIAAERDIKEEKVRDDIKLEINGNGATALIQIILNNKRYDSRIIKKDFLAALNEIVIPDLNFTDIATRHQGDLWEIFLETNNNQSIALSKMGSGIKTIILVLLNLIVIPKTSQSPTKEFVFAFEELENNLHPSLLRQLFTYITNYALKHNSYFFITTHSSLVIDFFSKNEHAQILHTKRNGDVSSVTTVYNYSHSKNILSDLEARASDILQSNGVIWVEGPSDRIYIKHWLSLIDSSLKEGIHYSILFYGGRLLSNLCFDATWVDQELIPLLKINHNAFVVIDRDGEDDTNINATKQRIQQEIDKSNCWITYGREIENYLSVSSLDSWLATKKAKKSVTYNKNEKLENTIASVAKNVKYNTNKKIYSSEIINHIGKEDLNVLDLEDKMNNLVKAIKLWNGIN